MAPSRPPPPDPELPCVLLYTSGTTAAPKAAVLRHRHLMSYLLGTVEFASAEEGDATLVSVPPYHVAGVANLLSNLYAGRRIIYLDRFDPETWLQIVRDEKVTQAMVVPTMLAQIVNHLGSAEDAETPSLQTLSYGGARMPAPVLDRALELFPDHRVRQRLRPHRDELDHRPARSGGPPRRLRVRRPEGPGPPRLGRSPGAGDRARGPRRGRHRARSRARPGCCSSGASRSPVSTPG